MKVERESQFYTAGGSAFQIRGVADTGICWRNRTLLEKGQDQVSEGEAD